MCNNNWCNILVVPAIVTRLLLARVSGSTFCINNHVNIALMSIVYVGQINDDSDSDSILRPRVGCNGSPVMFCFVVLLLLSTPSHYVGHACHSWFFFFSSHYTTPAQCWAQDLARGLNSSRSSWVQGCDRMGQTSGRFIVCSSPHSHVVCPSSLNLHFCIRDLHSPSPCSEAI